VDRQPVHVEVAYHLRGSQDTFAHGVVEAVHGDHDLVPGRAPGREGSCDRPAKRGAIGEGDDVAGEEVPLGVGVGSGSSITPGTWFRGTLTSTRA
jgi:hypothetical protein